MSTSSHFELYDLDNALTVIRNHVRRLEVSFLGCAAISSMPYKTNAFSIQARIYLRNAYCELAKDLRDKEEQKNRGYLKGRYW